MITNIAQLVRNFEMIIRQVWLKSKLFHLRNNMKKKQFNFTKRLYDHGGKRLQSIIFNSFDIRPVSIALHAPVLAVMFIFWKKKQQMNRI